MASNKQNKHRPIGKDVQFSKAMTYLLRHGAVNEGLNIAQDGFVKLDDLLAHRTLNRASKEELIQIVQNCPKQRFSIKSLRDENNQVEVLYIKANQGHSITTLDVQMEEIDEASKIDECLHGTYYKAWELIKNEGLSKMGRQHIHFSEDYPGSKQVISGMRSNCQVAIFLDVDKCLKDGIKFYRSENKVILSPGDNLGFIKPKYFKRVVDLKNGNHVFLLVKP